MEAPSATTGAGLLGVSGAVLLPIGVVHDFAGSSAPTGWFLCYGQAVSRTTYSELFGVIGTTYGAGDGSTTYNLPDLRGRLSAGRDDMGGSAANRITNVDGVVGITLGSAGGEETHTLVTTELPAVTPAGSITTTLSLAGGVNLWTGSGIGTAGGGGATTIHAPNGQVTVDFTGSTASSSFTGTPLGSGVGHNNLQPTMILNKIIFAGHP
jgi:microcystin-dependent protein